MANVKELNVNSTTYDIVGKAVEDQNNSGTPVKVWTGTKAEYDLLTPDANTIYNITDEDVPNDFVKKTGDTMTGKLYVQCSGAAFTTSNTDVTKGTNPASAKYCGLYFNDLSNDSDWKNTRIGAVESVVNTDGSTETRLTASKYVVGDSTQATISVKETAAGVASCTFPNTVRCDGQYVEASSTLASGVSLNGSSNLTYTLSDVPNDGYNHMVCLIATVTTGTTSGNNVMAQISSDLCPGGMNVSRAITRTSSNMSGTGTCWIPVSINRKIYLSRSTNYTGTCNLYMRGYRRIGENS